MRERGDTLIEVLLAMAILSLIIVGANALMNFGLRKAITATEHTQVSNLISSQAELLRYLRDHAGQAGSDATIAWHDIKTNHTQNNVTDIDKCPAPSDPSMDDAFYLTAAFSPSNPLDIKVKDYDGSTTTPPAVPDYPYATPGEGLWIEANKHTSSDQDYINFHIRACWRATSGITQRSSTVIRLRTE